MPDLPGNILTMLTNVPHTPSLARAYLDPVDMAPGENPPWNSNSSSLTGASADGNAIALQYWPESIQDSRSSEWSPKNIPGGSHPIYQWTNGGERRISFTAVFTTDTAPDDVALAESAEAQAAAAAASLAAAALGLEDDPYVIQETLPLSGVELGTRDVDLRAVVAWLRWFTYPYYDPESGWRAYEPPKCLLVLPKMGLAHNGGDSITTVMTQCDVTYEACFENGFPRLIEVALEFAEVVQSGERVQFHGRGDFTSSPAVNIGHYFSVSANAR